MRPLLRLLALAIAFAALAGSSGAATALPVGAVRVGERAEWVITDVPASANPYDPDQIRVDAEITTPSGRRWTQPAFWHQEFERALVAGREELKPAGEPHWRLRYRPTETGPHRITIRIQIPNTPAVPPTEVVGDVLPGDAGRGYVRRSPEQPADLVTEDGRQVRLIGANYCWPENQGTYDYDRWFNLLRRSGGNLARLWLAPWWAGLEHQPGRLNRYPLDEAWRLDHLFSQAEGNGIYLILCLDHHGMYQVSNQNWGGSNNFWSRNPYSVEAGGPCAKPNDFFTLEEARRTYQKRLRYLIARYGYSTSLLSWQFFNEIDNTFIQQVNGDDVLAWHQIMGRWLRAEDPMRHLISTSMTGGSDQPLFWALPELDFTVYHSYQDPAPARKLAELTADFVKRYQKPVVVGEFGVEARSWNIAIDPHLRGFRQCLWGTALGGSVGPGHSWWWEDLEKDLVYPLIANFARIMDHAGWHEGHWQPAPVRQNLKAPTRLRNAVAGAPTFNASVALNPGRRLPLSGIAAIPTAMAAERASEQLSQFLYGTRNPKLPSTLTLHVEAGSQAKISFRVNAVASDNQLLARVAGKEVLRVGFTNRDNLAQVNGEISQEFNLDIPAGQQTIEISNLGYDWTALENLRLSGLVETAFVGDWNYEPEAFALRNGSRAVVYVVAPRAVYPAGALRYRLAPTEGASVQLTGWQDGAYQVEWFDPESGILVHSSKSRAERDTLTLTAPPFAVDLAAVISAAPKQD